MSELFSAERWLALWNTVVGWVVEHVLVIDNAVQLVIVLLALGIAILVGRRVRPWLAAYRAPLGLTRAIRIVTPLVLAIVWLAVVGLSIAVAAAFESPNRLLVIFASLLTAWVVIRLASQIVTQPIWATMITWVAWSIAALSILDLLGTVIDALDRVGVDFGDGLRISLLTVAQSTLALVVLVSLAVYVTGMLESRIRTSKALSPSVQVLFAKSLKTVLIGIAILIAIRMAGINLTALAVLGGAIGLGVGFGLQRIVSNLISGVILLVDKSIKPGDVIAVAGTYGWVTALGGRYVSIVTRDGIEHLIPNELLISERVENWTHSNNQTRLKIDIGVHYKSNVRQVMELCVQAATETERVLEFPEPKCLLMEFGESSINLQVRIWISDAHNGVQNVKSAVLLAIWDKFQEHGIEIPYPQRDVHLRTRRSADDLLDDDDDTAARTSAA